jgi:hypothetical protein
VDVWSTVDCVVLVGAAKEEEMKISRGRTAKWFRAIVQKTSSRSGEYRKKKN